MYFTPAASLFISTEMILSWRSNRSMMRCIHASNCSRATASGSFPLAVFRPALPLLFPVPVLPRACSIVNVSITVFF